MSRKLPVNLSNRILSEVAKYKYGANKLFVGYNEISNVEDNAIRNN